VWPVGDALRSQRWTPSFGQPGSDVRVDSMRLSMLPCAIWSIPPLAFCRA
jgi:hypothetical protein